MITNTENKNHPTCLYKYIEVPSGPPLAIIYTCRLYNTPKVFVTEYHLFSFLQKAEGLGETVYSTKKSCGVHMYLLLFKNKGSTNDCSKYRTLTWFTQPLV